MTPETSIEQGQQPQVLDSRKSMADCCRFGAAGCRTPYAKVSSLRTRLCLLALLAVVLLSAILAGCASVNDLQFSGGGVPIGGSRLIGRAVSAANTSISLPNVDVSIQATPAGGVPKNLETTTHQDGSFSFSNVLPGFSNGTVDITATPADAAYQPQHIAFRIANGHTQQVILTLPPATFDRTTAKSISLSLASPAIPTGGSVQVQAHVLGANGKSLDVTPTLVFDGNFGTLSPDGTFTVPEGILSGSGAISAYWYDLQPQTQQVRVDDTASPQPPNPPVLPGGGTTGNNNSP